MDLHQFRCVLAIEEYGSFTRAAEALHLTQSSLSYAIGRLERELRTPLFSRLGRRVILTPAGTAFLPGAREALRAANAASEAATGSGALVTGRLDVASTETLRRFTAEVVGALIRLHPAITASITVWDNSEVGDAVRRSVAPVSVAWIDALPADLRAVALYREEVVVLLPPGTTAPTSISVADLRTWPLVISRRRSGARARFAHEVLGDGPMIVAEADGVETVIELVLAGVGAAVMSGDGTRAAVERGAVVAPLTPRLHYTVGVVHRAGQLTPLEQAFCDIARQTATKDRCAASAERGS